jgi:hypothetical protein
LQLKADLYQRQCKAITNFEATLPSPQSDLAQQTIKDPYVFDFMGLAELFKEYKLRWKTAYAKTINFTIKTCSILSLAIPIHVLNMIRSPDQESPDGS